MIIKVLDKRRFRIKSGMTEAVILNLFQDLKLCSVRNKKEEMLKQVQHDQETVILTNVRILSFRKIIKRDAEINSA